MPAAFVQAGDLRFDLVFGEVEPEDVGTAGLDARPRGRWRCRSETPKPCNDLHFGSRHQLSSSKRLAISVA